ncbi:4-hydroxythreonine-4-phosphate dehydrogenase PdxA [Flexithrix dorotheae]|uniref:4-hydroxythreonine-4-phosphate dehydrogenase PdxA n=1 Tax=Flexithrix dorotheae TaxID=70993 RepID=UPI000360E57A|nr:4-hydroxythreonine-4-phosphate dehydrogenase PdxA [Flexithrix dorotheae]
MDNSNTKNKTKPKIGITIGDFNGVGPEVIIKALGDSRISNICTPIIYGSGKILTKYKRALNIEKFSYHQYNENSYINERKPNLINCWHENYEIDPGRLTDEAGKSAFLAIKESTKHLKDGFIDAVVTCPISKENIQSEEFKFPGHTEYYASAFESRNSLMMLCSQDLRVAVATGHIPLEKVKQRITKELLTKRLKVLIKSLKVDFGILKPRIAVLGLNPHAGEGGLLGKEEQEIISPVISDLKNRGNLIGGPFPADGFFGTYSFQKYDAVLAMYHDQGLIPFKTIAFDTGVNFTAGLPIVRTSPDHGTAFNIAGLNKASETSLRESIYLACDIVRNRSNVITNQIRVNVSKAEKEKMN